MDDLPGIREALDRRLDARSTAPIVVAFSGGGDSLALLLAAHRWAGRAGRRVIAVTIDHRLQAAGADWAAWCADRARALGVAHRVLAWEGDKPRTGIPAAARHARHALLAQAARDAGACVILMGHTADDCLEARLMRAAGVSASEPREWSPSPLWPQGRGLFLLRPLLNIRRAAIRERLAAAGETWIDDPANADPRHPRVRARFAIAAGRDPGPSPDPPDLAPLVAHATVSETGEITLEPQTYPLLGKAILCAAGTSRPPRRDRLARLTTGAPTRATLAGARIVGDGRRLHISREPGELIRSKLQPVCLTPGEPIVWDGRFEITARTPGLTVVPAGNAPAISGDPAGFILTCLVRPRFLAACGAIPNEAALRLRACSSSAG